MRILVTGGAGYIGSVLIGKLLKEGYEVVCVDNLRYSKTSLLGYISNERFKFVYGDARDKELMKKLSKNVDFIIPLAAVVGAPASAKNPFLTKSLNYDAIKMLVEICPKDVGIIYPNTNSGYGRCPAGTFCTEESPLNPLSLYAKTKVEAEKVVMDRGNTVSLRLATVFGVSPRMRLDLLVNNFVYRAMKDKVLVIFEPHFRRNYIHVEDVADTFIFVIKNFDRMKDNVFNVGLNTANLTKLELAHKIKEQIPELVILVSDYAHDPDKRDYYISTKKLESFGWKAKKSLEEGIKELIKAYPMFEASEPFVNNI